MPLRLRPAWMLSLIDWSWLCTAVIDTCDACRAACAEFWRDVTAVGEPATPTMQVNPGKSALIGPVCVGPQVDCVTVHVLLILQLKVAVPPGPVHVILE